MGIYFLGQKVAEFAGKKEKSEPFGSDFMVDDTRLELVEACCFAAALRRRSASLNVPSARGHKFETVRSCKTKRPPLWGDRLFWWTIQDSNL